MFLVGVKDILFIFFLGKEFEVKMLIDVEVKLRLFFFEKVWIWEVGMLGFFENLICNVYYVMNIIMGGVKLVVRNVFLYEINKVVEEIIFFLLEEGCFVGFEEVKVRFCKDFGKLSFIEMGFRIDKDIFVLKNLIEM